MTDAHTKAIFSHCSAVFHYKSTTGLFMDFMLKLFKIIDFEIGWLLVYLANHVGRQMVFFMIYTFFKELHIVLIYFYRICFVSKRMTIHFFPPCVLFGKLFCTHIFPLFSCKTWKHTTSTVSDVLMTHHSSMLILMLSTWVVWWQTSGILFPYFNTHTDCH